jgi:antitoxin (DNA-binding transcriptional repressor) of toxin-antitoxin stability system
MKAVGVKSLKARLSAYLRAVKAGDTILVTERDEVIAELRPARGRLQPEGTCAEVLSMLVETGEVSAPTLPKQGFLWKTTGLGLPPGTASALLADVREERT